MLRLVLVLLAIWALDLFFGPPLIPSPPAPPVSHPPQAWRELAKSWASNPSPNTLVASSNVFRELGTITPGKWDLAELQPFFEAVLVRADETGDGELLASLYRAVSRARPHPSQWWVRRAIAARLLEKREASQTAWRMIAEGELHQTVGEVVELNLSSPWPATGGIFGAYGRRVADGRRIQLQKVARELQPVLAEGTYKEYREAVAELEVPVSSPLLAIFTLRLDRSVGNEDLAPFALWWQLAADKANHYFLGLVATKQRGKFWLAGLDDDEQGGEVEAKPPSWSLEVPTKWSGGDWVLRL